MKKLILRWLGIPDIWEELKHLDGEQNSDYNTLSKRIDDEFAFCAGEIEKLRGSKEAEPSEQPGPLVRRAGSFKDFREAAEAPLHKRRQA